MGVGALWPSGGVPTRPDPHTGGGGSAGTPPPATLNRNFKKSLVTSAFIKQMFFVNITKMPRAFVKWCLPLIDILDEGTIGFVLHSSPRPLQSSFCISIDNIWKKEFVLKYSLCLLICANLLLVSLEINLCRKEIFFYTSPCLSPSK